MKSTFIFWCSVMASPLGQASDTNQPSQLKTLRARQMQVVPANLEPLLDMISKVPTSPLTSWMFQTPYKVIEEPSTLPFEGVKRMKIIYGPIKAPPTKVAATMSDAGGQKTEGNKGEAPAPGTVGELLNTLKGLMGKGGGTGSAGSSAIAAMAPGGTTYGGLVTGFPKDSMILMSSSEMIFKDGTKCTRDSGVYNHHMVYVDITKRVNNVAQCPGQTTMNSAVGNILSAQDDQARDKQWFAVQDGSMKSGYYLAGENKIFQFGELVNYTNETQDVFMQTTLEYVPQNVGSYLDASLQVVSVTSCGTGSGPGGYGVTQPKGMMAWNSKSKDLTIAEDGFLIGTLAHAHDGAVRMEMRINNDLYCRSEASYAPYEKMAPNPKTGKPFVYIKNMSGCEDKVVKVKKGDILTLEAFYDLDKYPPREQADGSQYEEMGMAVAVFAKNVTMASAGKAS